MWGLTSDELLAKRGTHCQGLVALIHTSTDKHMYCTIYHGAPRILGCHNEKCHYFFPEHNPTTTLAYSFNTFTNTSFDVQSIVLELLSSPKAYQAHLPISCTRMPAERKGDRFQRLHIHIKDPLHTKLVGITMCRGDLLNW
jgi:hypothetical protein